MRAVLSVWFFKESSENSTSHMPSRYLQDVIYIFFYFLNVYLLLRERKQVGEGQRDRGTEDLKEALH